MRIADPFHHLHIRKRVHQQLQPFPSTSPFKQILDHLIYVVGLSGPLLTLPQLLAIWEAKSVTGLSPITWGSYVVIACFWLLYGIVHKERPIIFTNTLWIFIHGAIVASIIHFR